MAGRERAWSEDEWNRHDAAAARAACACRTDRDAGEVIRRHARRVLRTYSTSFFMVTRFLPAAKRGRVEVLYAAVRYPDEIVDTFPLDAGARLARLDGWARAFDTALALPSPRAALHAGIPPILAAWAQVVRELGIPPRYYHDFLGAMRLDACPQTFATLDDLVERYVYGSAIVVGYFLAYVYGPAPGRGLDAALASARDLGVALQLTNFIRDVGEDARRGRVYLPQDALTREGIARLDAADPAQHAALARVVRTVAASADGLYARSLGGLDAFAEDSRVAIRACIEVYRQLNARIAGSAGGGLQRERVPFADKYRVLPASKYWRLPLAYLGS